MDESVETTETEKPKSFIHIEFKGVHDTQLSGQLIGVDTVQIEIAANFLRRLAEAQFAQAAQMSANQQRGIVIPPPGMVRV